MPRNVWAKVYCDLLRHPLLRQRPDCDVRLVVGLVLYAKEHALDGVLHGLDAEEARGLFGIKAPLRTVQEGWQYLIDEGWLLFDGPSRTYRIRDFVQRQQRAGDTPEAIAIRQQRYYAKHKDVVLERKKSSRASLRESSREETALPNAVLTSDLTSVHRRPHGSFPHAEEEEERTNSDLSAVTVGGNSQAPVDNAALEAADLTDSDKAQLRNLLGQGKGSEATALFGSLQRDKDLRRKAGGAE